MPSVDFGAMTPACPRAPTRASAVATERWPPTGLAHSGEQIATRLLAAATNLSANTAVVMVGRVAIAFRGARATYHNACLDRGAYDAEVGLCLTGHDPAGRVAHIGAVEIEPNAPH